MKLADLLAQKANATDETLTDLTQAQHLLSTLTPSLKTSALAALSKTAQHDEKTPALSDEDLASLSALFAMLPGQPVATPVAGETPAENHIALPSLLRGDMPSAPQEEHIRSLLASMKRENRGVACARQRRSRHGAITDAAGGRCRRDQRESGGG